MKEIRYAPESPRYKQLKILNINKKNMATRVVKTISESKVTKLLYINNCKIISTKKKYPRFNPFDPSMKFDPLINIKIHIVVKKNLK